MSVPLFYPPKSIGTLIRAPLSWWRARKSKAAYEAARAHFAKREAEALRRGDTRAIGAVRAERRSLVHASLEAGRVKA